MEIVSYSINVTYNMEVFQLYDRDLLDEYEMKKYCINLEIFLRFNEYSDIDGFDLLS